MRWRDGKIERDRGEIKRSEREGKRWHDEDDELQLGLKVYNPNIFIYLSVFISNRP